MKSAAIYPGTFDPLTLGHVDLVRRAAKMFDRLILAILVNPRKEFLFSLEERVEMARLVAAEFDNVEVDSFQGLLVDYARMRDVRIIVRGIRAFSDFEYEFQMALTNRKMAPDVETLFMMPKEIYSYVSSSLVREVASIGGDIGEFVPDFVRDALEKRFSAQERG